jgi:hypothetical protein
LSSDDRRFMEPRFGHDFSRVRVHTDRTAAKSAEAVNAAAYTVGPHVVFANGRYESDTESGRRLLAHELAHVIQQNRNGAPSGTLSIVGGDDPGELEARKAANAVVADAGAQTVRQRSSTAGRIGVARRVAESGPAVADERAAETYADQRLFGTKNGTHHEDESVGKVALTRITPALASGGVIARSRAEDVVDNYTSWMNLDEEALGAYLLGRARAGDLVLVQQVLDELGSTNRDDVSLAFMEAATEADLAMLVQASDGRALLDRLYDELTSGSVAADEQRQADRIMAAKGSRISPQDFVAGVAKAKIFSFKLSGTLTGDDAPIHAERRGGGKVFVDTPSRVVNNPDFREETQTRGRQASAEELPEDEIIGVKMYDLGGDTIYRPALYLVELSNASTRHTLGVASEAFFFGLTLGSGALVGKGATVTARVLLAADRVAFAVGTMSSILRDQRDWIVERFGDNGKTFLHYVDMIHSAVAIYGGVRALVGMGQMVAGFAKSLSQWRAAKAAAESELTAAQKQILDQVDQQADAVLKDIQTIQSEQAAATSNVTKGGTGQPFGPEGPTGPKVGQEVTTPKISSREAGAGPGHELPSSRTPKVGPEAPTGVPSSALQSMTPLQGKLAAEAHGMLHSKELGLIRVGHALGKEVEVTIQGRTVIYNPELEASGMSLFGEDGFLIGREAFKSEAELTKTILHELHRLTTTASKAEGVSGALAAEETKAAATFADDVYEIGVKVGLW